MVAADLLQPGPAAGIQNFLLGTYPLYIHFLFYLFIYFKRSSIFYGPPRINRKDIVVMKNKFTVNGRREKRTSRSIYPGDICKSKEQDSAKL